MGAADPYDVLLWPGVHPPKSSAGQKAADASAKHLVPATARIPPLASSFLKRAALLVDELCEVEK